MEQRAPLVKSEIPGHPGYFIDEECEIYGPKGILKPWISKKGYPTVRLSRGKKLGVHQVVALVHLGVRPPGKEVRHLDNNKLNFNPSNIKYGTHLENMRDSLKAECARGHKYEGESYYVSSRGKRVCRLCQKIHNSKHPPMTPEQRERKNELRRIRRRNGGSG